MTIIDDVQAPVPRQLQARAQRFGMVTVGTASLGQASILVLHVGLGVGPVLANALATGLVSLVGYALCTRYVWTSDKARRYTFELPGFVIASLLGLLLSTIAVAAASHASKHPLVPNLASAAGFALAWAVRFAVLDRLIFGRGRHLADGAPPR